MANLPLAFAELLIGSILVDAAVKGASISDVVQGKAQQSSVSSNTTGTSSGASTSTSTSSTSSTGPGYGTVGYGVDAPAPSTPSSNATFGQVSFSDLQTIGKAKGWTEAQIAAWWALLPLESNGTVTDTNPSSGAYGIAQFINGPSEYATYGGSATTVMGQLTSMANYIQERYGDPVKALAFHYAHNWY